MIGDKCLLVVQVGVLVSILLDRVELLKEILIQFKLKVLLLHRKIQGPQVVLVVARENVSG